MIKTFFQQFIDVIIKNNIYISSIFYSKPSNRIYLDLRVSLHDFVVIKVYRIHMPTLIIYDDNGEQTTIDEIVRYFNINAPIEERKANSMPIGYFDILNIYAQNIVNFIFNNDIRVSFFYNKKNSDKLTAYLNVEETLTHNVYELLHPIAKDFFDYYSENIYKLKQANVKRDIKDF